MLRQVQKTKAFFTHVQMPVLCSDYPSGRSPRTIYEAAGIGAGWECIKSPYTRRIVFCRAGETFPYTDWHSLCVSELLLDRLETLMPMQRACLLGEGANEQMTRHEVWEQYAPTMMHCGLVDHDPYLRAGMPFISDWSLTVRGAAHAHALMWHRDHTQA